MVADFLGNPKHAARVTIPATETRAAWEERAFGFAHWLDPWRINGRAQRAIGLESSGLLRRATERGPGRRAFLVVGVRLHKDRRGRRMGFLEMRTASGQSVRGVAFGSVWPDIAESVRPGRVLVMSGDIDREGVFVVGQRPAVIDIDRATA
jgi:DNA polymerase III alpha subunit